MARARTAGLGLLFAILVVSAATTVPTSATAREMHVSGSVAATYVQSFESNRKLGLNQGISPEAALKTSVDLGGGEDGPSLYVAAKVCFGCHQFEMDRFYAEAGIDELINVKIGRFNPAFGDFPIRHDPANHQTASNPLPYAMGRMVRGGETGFNSGVLPIPYVDTGAEVYGSIWPADVLQIWYAAHLVAGMKGNNDLDFKKTRDLALEDTNATPSYGGRLLISLVDALPGVESFTVGASVIHGPYDGLGNLEYTIAGVDAVLRASGFELRAEGLRRDTDLQISLYPEAVRESVAAGRTSDFMRKESVVIEAGYAVTRGLRFLVRYDTLHRKGLPLPQSFVDGNSTIQRITAGTSYEPIQGAILKLGYEYWHFSDYPVAHTGYLEMVGFF